MGVRRLSLVEQRPAEDGRGRGERRAHHESQVVAAGESGELLGLPSARSESVRVAARLARTARPSAPPIMNAVFTTPDARPDSSGFTSLIAASSIGLNAMPAPKPSRIMLGRTSVTKFPSTGTRTNSARPAEARNSPVASGRLMPNRMTIFAESPSEKVPMIRLAGRNARPTSSGL